ncbi:MAG: carboxypeptidase regulatory-like domain-containing protein [Candidatus Hydrogenedentes bacterium]|nr:carboxypeptidase regulatory-like domain-containing protein [Candidatus Hydrogenedentota bacterium]
MLNSLALLSLLSLAATVNGAVNDAQGRPVAGAQVFMESGIQAALVQTETSASGQFHFDDVEIGGIGFFAIAPGLAFGGAHRNITVADTPAPIEIALYPPASLTVEVGDHKGKPIAGATVSRVGIKTADKVGIPLSKLEPYGISMPVSGEDGRLVIGNLPAQGSVDIKLGHPEYAQEGIVDVPVSSGSYKASLYPGVRVDGQCLSRGKSIPVARASILIRNAQPPHDTAVTSTDNYGNFAIRLKPGVYLYQAAGVGLRSPGWEELTVTGELPQPKATLVVAGVGEIRGEVRDAVSSEPIEGARLVLRSFGNTAGVVRTGPTGEYRFTAAEGPNQIRLELAPGYYPPQSQTMEVTVQQGESAEAPGLWLRPLPSLRLTVVEEDGAPVPGALVSLLRPEQFGWYATNDQGTAELHVQNYPADDSVYGSVQSRDGQRGAIFRQQVSATEPARVQLLPWASVSGTVRNTRSKAVQGAVVGAVYPGEENDAPLLLWRVLSKSDGTFSWPLNVPGIPLRCAAIDHAHRTGLSNLFNGTPGGASAVGEVVIPEGESGESHLGQRFRLPESALRCGAPLATGRPAVVFFCEADALASVQEGMRTAGSLGLDPLPQMILVVSTPVPCGAEEATIYQGTPPSAATTLVLDAEGVVVLETFGLPPVAMLSRK